MDLWRLHIFCKVVEQKSFSKAASSVYLSQPTVSSHIKDLEDHFSCKLVDRLGREAAPTKAGELLYEHARKIMALKENTEKAMAEFQGKMKGRLTIGGSTIPGGYILPPLLGKFKKTYPEVVLTLTEGDSTQIIQKVVNGHIELGVVGTKPKEPQLTQKKLIDDEMFLFVSADHKWANRSHVTVKDLATEPFVMREAGSGTRRSIEEVLDKLGHWLGDFNVVAEMGSTEAIRQAIKTGVGISILSQHAVADDLSVGNVRQVKIEGISFQRAFYLIIHKHRTASPLCRAFVSFLEDENKNA
jgi:DNA-binding transcriptional LysR family regulator